MAQRPHGIHQDPDGSRRTLVYDSGCAMCRSCARFVRRMDWLHRLDITPYAVAAERFADVAAHELDEGVQLRHPSGQVDIGIDAVRSVMLATPLGMLVGWLLYVPPLRKAGARLYRRVAARRARCAQSVEDPVR